MDGKRPEDEGVWDIAGATIDGETTPQTALDSKVKIKVPREGTHTQALRFVEEDGIRIVGQGEHLGEDVGGGNSIQRQLQGILVTQSQANEKQELELLQAAQDAAAIPPLPIAPRMLPPTIPFSEFSATTNTTSTAYPFPSNHPRSTSMASLASVASTPMTPATPLSPPVPTRPLDPHDILLEAVERGNMDRVRSALGRGGDPQQARKEVVLQCVLETGEIVRDEQKVEDAMAIAVRMGRADLVEVLLEAGYDPSTPIDWKIACYHSPWSDWFWHQERWLTPPTLHFNSALDLAVSAAAHLWVNLPGARVGIRDPQDWDQVRREIALVPNEKVVAALLDGGAEITQTVLERARDTAEGIGADGEPVPSQPGILTMLEQSLASGRPRKAPIARPRMIPLKPPAESLPAVHSTENGPSPSPRLATMNLAAILEERERDKERERERTRAYPHPTSRRRASVVVSVGRQTGPASIGAPALSSDTGRSPTTPNQARAQLEARLGELERVALEVEIRRIEEGMEAVLGGDRAVKVLEKEVQRLRKEVKEMRGHRPQVGGRHGQAASIGGWALFDTAPTRGVDEQSPTSLTSGSPRGRGGKQVRENMYVLHPHEPEDTKDGEVALSLGDKVLCLFKFNGGWAAGTNKTTCQTGYFPYACLTSTPPSELPLAHPLPRLPAPRYVLSVGGTDDLAPVPLPVVQPPERPDVPHPERGPRGSTAGLPGMDPRGSIAGLVGLDRLPIRGISPLPDWDQVEDELAGREDDDDGEIDEDYEDGGRW
ncbi:hypothetical protein HDU93_004538 [Gonapodya sp. JEL0774]|nr:hypothetical protein HDU93_004538 [Gonapodya sp. JEL0774]